MQSVWPLFSSRSSGLGNNERTPFEGSHNTHLALEDGNRCAWANNGICAKFRLMTHFSPPHSQKPLDSARFIFLFLWELNFSTLFKWKPSSSARWLYKSLLFLTSAVGFFRFVSFVFCKIYAHIFCTRCMPQLSLRSLWRFLLCALQMNLPLQSQEIPIQYGVYTVYHIP